MYAFRSSGSRKGLHALCIVSMIGAVGLYALSGAEQIQYEWAIQLTAIILAGVSVYLLTRYSLREYRYELVDSGLADRDGEPVYELCVTQVIGRRMTPAARATLRDIREVKVLDRAAFKKQKASLLKDATLLRCENDPFLPASCYICVPSVRAVIAIPPDPGMVRLLDAAVRQAEQDGDDEM